jgi:hypothetical protein
VVCHFLLVLSVPYFAMRISNILLFFALAITHVSADESVYVNDVDYDNGILGMYPVQVYKTVGFLSPRINVLRSDPECSDELYTIFAPRGGFPTPSAMILDSGGHLIWTISGYGQIYNLMVQEYLGEDYLTFWGGDDTVGGHGAGLYYMVSEIGQAHKHL